MLSESNHHDSLTQKFKLIIAEIKMVLEEKNNITTEYRTHLKNTNHTMMVMESNVRSLSLLT